MVFRRRIDVDVRATYRCLLAGLFLLMLVPASATTQPPPGRAFLKLLNCSYGSVSFQPSPLPPGFENQFAVAVFEVNGTMEMQDAPSPSITPNRRNGKSDRYQACDPGGGF